MTSKLAHTAILILAAPFLIVGAMLGLAGIVIGQIIQSICKVWR